MSPEDAAKVLLLVQVYDNRSFDEYTAKAWADALDSLELGDCLDAVRNYFRRSREWLMPAALRDEARKILRERKEQERRESDRLALEAMNRMNDYSDRIAELIALADEASKMPAEPSPHPGKPDRPQRREAFKVGCTWCEVGPGTPCRNKATDRPSGVIHETRLIAAGLMPDPNKSVDA